MAEFPTLGQNCTFPQCNDLDFLPFQCPHCANTFCSKHRSVTDHNCGPWNEMQKRKPTTNIEPYESYKCHFGACTQKDQVPLICRLCEQHFCLQHRHEYDHNCCKIENKHESKPSKAAEFVQSLKKDSVDKSPAKSKPTSKPEGLAAKVAYMKLKQSAVGDRQKIPDEERVYFNIELPESFTYKNSNSMPFIFSKIWTIGKCIDLVATLAKVPIKCSVDSSKKLRLFSNDNDVEKLLPVDETLEKLISNQLIYDTQNLKVLYV